MSDEVKKGLEGVLVAESELSNIDGDVGKLIYRGYAIEDLSRHASYEEVLYLLWHGHLPDRDELAEFETAMAEERSVDDGVIDVVGELAEQDEDPMAAFRTVVSMLSAYDPEESGYDTDDGDALLRKGRRITAKMPTVLAAFSRIHDGE